MLLLIIQVKEGQLRCGEHSDYGSITLLFQDSIGGLEVGQSELVTCSLKHCALNTPLWKFRTAMLISYCRLFSK